jgi:hypothetical protein
VQALPSVHIKWKQQRERDHQHDHPGGGFPGLILTISQIEITKVVADSTDM